MKNGHRVDSLGPAMVCLLTATPETVIHGRCTSPHSRRVYPFHGLATHRYESPRLCLSHRAHLSALDQAIYPFQWAASPERTGQTGNRALLGSPRRSRHCRPVDTTDGAERPDVPVHKLLRARSTSAEFQLRQNHAQAADSTYAQGSDIHAIKKLLGHDDVTTTEIYTHVLNRGAMGVISPVDG